MDMKIFKSLSVRNLFMLNVFFSGCGGAFATTTFDAEFSLDTIGPGNRSILIHTISTDSATPITDMNFVGTLPVGVTLATPAIASSTCVDGTLTATDGADSITIVDMKLAANSTCTITATVVSATPGTHTYLTDSFTASDGTSVTATDDLTVDTGIPSVTLTLDSSTAFVGEDIRATFNYDNTANGDYSLVLDNSISLPSGLEISDFAETSSDCTFASTPVLSSSAGGDTLSLSSGGVAAGATCTASVNLKVTSAGSQLLVNDDSEF